MDDAERLALIVEAVLYCRRVRAMGMPPACYSKALREPVHFLWERRAGTKVRVAKFRSKNAKGLTFGSGNLVYDHAIPFRYPQAELLDLSEVAKRSVASVLSRFGTIVLITREEDARLGAAGYGRTMPLDWDGLDHLARYRAVGIELIENTGATPVRPLVVAQ
jgi:hypothetical protein